jgi:ribosomal protein L21E
MIKRKKAKTHGKLSLSQYFKEFKEGDRIAVVREHSLNPAFPKRIQGKSGVVAGKKGGACVVQIFDGNELKTYVIKPMHLRKL